MPIPFVHPSAAIGGTPEHREFHAQHQDPRLPDPEMIRPVVSPSVRIEAFVSVDSGIFRATTVGARTWLMKHVHLGHDVHVGSDCELAPGTVIGGECTIGNGVKFGVNSTVRPQITIGDGARIGAGAVVVKNVPPGVTVVGNPAKPLVKSERTANMGLKIVR